MADMAESFTHQLRSRAVECVLSGVGHFVSILPLCASVWHRTFNPQVVGSSPTWPTKMPSTSGSFAEMPTSNLQHFAGIVSSATRGWCPAPRTEPKRSELPARTLLYVANAGGLAGLDSSTSRMFRQKRR